MSKYRNALPQLSGGLYLTDSGLETTLIFHDGMELPHFASFDLMRTTEGKERLRRYYVEHADLARRSGAGFVLESPTWRASRDWGLKLGYSRSALAAVNAECIELLGELRAGYDAAGAPFVISANLGPRGDGYVAGELMEAGEAEDYHAEQIDAFHGTDADLISAFTITNVPEAVGIARAASRAGFPVVISFTVETDARLPDGTPLHRAVAAVDEATDGAPAYYMINCAHPEHFLPALEQGGAMISRVRGIRANASKRSHAELNEAPDLDAGDPIELGGSYRDLLARHGQINVLGGCCGTDFRHIAEIARACTKQ